MSWITFLSDYGAEDAFVGMCKGVIARITPDARVIDVCHQSAPQDVEQAAVQLCGAIAYLPVGVHLVAVDPVRADPVRAVVAVAADGSRFVCPDNGVASQAWETIGGLVAAFEITDSSLWLAEASAVFRGRDVLAPVAARLAAGLEPSAVGPAVDVATLATVPVSEGYVHGDHVHGDIVAVDHFGNLALDLVRADLEAAGLRPGDTVELRCGGNALAVPFTRHYGEVEPGRVAVCEDSFRRITVAVNLGSAARVLRARRREPVVIARRVDARPVPAGRIGVLDPPT